MAYLGGCSGPRVLKHPPQPSYTSTKMRISLLDTCSLHRLTYFFILGDALACKVCARFHLASGCGYNDIECACVSIKQRRTYVGKT